MFFLKKEIRRLYPKSLTLFYIKHNLLRLEPARRGQPEAWKPYYVSMPLSPLPLQIRRPSAPSVDVIDFFRNGC